MRNSYHRFPRRKPALLALLYLALAATVVFPVGCAGGAGTTNLSASFPQCIDPSRGLPMSHTYPCNAIHGHPIGF